MSSNHRVVAIEQESDVYIELAKVRQKCGQMKKAYERERCIHIFINIVLTVMLFIHYG